MNLSPSEIRTRLPHAPPFVLVDRVENAAAGRGRALKTFTPDEPWFAWHFPGDPVVPASIVLEAMAQAAGLVHSADAAPGPPLRVYAAVSNFRIRRPLRPGDAITIDVARTAVLGTLVRFETVARLNGAVAAEAEITLGA